MIRVLAIFALSLMQGCSVYLYEKTPDSVKVSVYSTRDVQAGDLRISKDGAVSGSADSLTANEKSLEAINSLIQKIP